MELRTPIAVPDPLVRRGMHASAVQPPFRPRASGHVVPQARPGPGFGHAARRGDQDSCGLISDRGFLSLREAYQAHGGISREDDLSRLIENYRPTEFVDLRELIASGRIVGIRWQQKFWVPTFQVDLYDMSIKPQVRQVLTEFGAAPSGWMLALWFIRCNSRLRNQRPVALLDSNPLRLMKVARAHR